ncbi:hypothetical protein H4R18_004626, partial [Coemansia javaensis]
MRLAPVLGWAAAVLLAAASPGAAADAGAYAAPAVSVLGARQKQNLCSHPIYCSGTLLERVMLSGVFTKDKTFVDMPTRQPVSKVLAAFNQIAGNLTKAKVAKFVDDNFYPIGSDVVEAELEDWTDDPPFLRGVTDPLLRGFGMAVHNQWKKLARKRDPSRLCAGCASSLLPVNNTFIVPGGASSREFNYWHSYYINMGLLRSGLFKTARGALQNLLDMVATYGFVPTGGRVYYTDRSQVPLLALMVKDYYNATQDLAFVRAALPLLERELAYWYSHRSIDISYTTNDENTQSRSVATTKIATFGSLLAPVKGPNLFVTSGVSSSSLVPAARRPEGFLGDSATLMSAVKGPTLFATAVGSGSLFAASEAGTVPGVQYADLQTAIKGPALFSSTPPREIELPADNPFDSFSSSELAVLYSIEINQTISVNLNSALFQVETAVADLLALTNNGSDTAGSTRYRGSANSRRDTLFDLTHNPRTGLFADYNTRTKAQTKIWSLSSLWPSWAFGDELPSASAQKALQYMADLHTRFPGGLPNTLYNSSLGWDLPYVRAPLQHMAIQSAAKVEALPGLERPATASGQSLSASIAQSTLQAAFCNWYTTGGAIAGTLDPYDSTSAGNGTGSSFGSYSVDASGNLVVTTDASDAGDYAWTNGVLIWVFDQYKSQLRTPVCPVKLNIVKPPPPPV